MVSFSARLPLTGPQVAPPTPSPASEGIRQNFTLPDPNGNPRTIRAFLPPTYFEKPRKAFPLLLMQDGQNLFEDEDAFQHQSWRLGAALSDGWQSGNLRELIAVGIDNDGVNRENEYTPDHDADRYLDWVESTVLPEIERRYRVLSGSENRTIGGSSLGAVLSLYALVKKSHLFGSAMLMSGTWQWPFQGGDMVDWIKSQWQSVPRGMRLWMSRGSDEKKWHLYEANTKMNGVLSGLFKGKGQYLFKELEGDHNEPSWRNQINDPTKSGAERYGPLGHLFSV